MDKAERVDRIDNDFYSESDVLYWLPEIDLIHDEELRDLTMQTFLDGCPRYFIKKPSSSSGKYHSVDERGEYGNLIHTKRVFAEYAQISESWVEMGVITPREKEEGKSASLIHDMMKYGWPSEGNEHTVNNHDLIAASVAEHIGGVPDNVVRLIETHMGAWGEGPTPDTPAERLLHTADMSAARQYNDIGVYHVPEKVLDEWPDIVIEEYEEGDVV